jgi:hypothetical protein
MLDDYFNEFVISVIEAAFATIAVDKFYLLLLLLSLMHLLDINLHY